MVLEKIECRTPTKGKAQTKIHRWKYDEVANGILHLVPKEQGGLIFVFLADLVADFIGPEKMAKRGSSRWYTTVAKLEHEVTGVLYRVTTCLR